MEHQKECSQPDKDSHTAAEDNRNEDIHSVIKEANNGNKQIQELNISDQASDTVCVPYLLRWIAVIDEMVLAH